MTSGHIQLAYTTFAGIMSLFSFFSAGIYFVFFSDE